MGCAALEGVARLVDLVVRTEDAVMLVPTVLLLAVWAGVAITERSATVSVVAADAPTLATFLVLEIITAARLDTSASAIAPTPLSAAQTRPPPAPPQSLSPRL